MQDQSIDLLDKLNDIKFIKQKHIPIKVQDDNASIFTSKETLYYNMIKKYFRTDGKQHTQTMADIINGSSNISLRLLDWFVTRFADEQKTRYTIKETNETFNIHISYKAQLRSYKKKYFDPFRRRKKKFNFSYIDQDMLKNKFHTTIGQLNFFKWAFTNNLIDYVVEHKNELTIEMNKCHKDDKIKKTKKPKVVKVHNDICVIAKQKIVDGKMKISISFD